MKERHHDELGGSSAARWTTCPGSVFLARQVPAPEAGEAAEEGTLMHGYAEKAVNLMLEAWRTTGDKEAHVKFIESMPESQEKKDDILDYCMFVWDKIFNESVTGKAWDLETYFALDKKLNMGGSVDLWAIWTDDHGKRVLAVLDFKYGYHEVAAKGNAQLAFYACAIRKFLQKHGKDIDYCKAFIYQPRAASGEVEKETKFTAAQLDSWMSKFQSAAHQVYVKKQAKFKPGSHCRWCCGYADGSPKCHARLHYAEKETGLTVIQSTRDIKLPTVDELSDEAIVKIALCGDILTSLVKSCKAMIITRASTGHAMPHVKVIEGKRKRMWKPDETAIINGLKNLGVEKPTVDKLRPLSQIEKLIGKESLDQFVQLSGATPLVVPEDDPAPALEGPKLGVLEE